MKPRLDFFVIGPARCGTSSIYRAFGRHPGIYAPPVKEPRFFSKNYGKGWEWYAQNYAGADPERLRGDFSPDYATAATGTRARRIAQAYPGAKIIHTIRNPIDCAISNWRMTAQANRRAIPFAQALADWASVVVGRSLFYSQIEKYREHFPDGQIMSVPFVERAGNPRVLIDLQHFLGVEPIKLRVPHVSQSDKRPNRPEKPDVPEDVRRRFIDLVVEDAAKMLRYAGLPADFWDLSETYPGWS